MQAVVHWETVYLGFWEHQVNEDQFETDPNCVEQGEVLAAIVSTRQRRIVPAGAYPVLWQVRPGNGVSLVTDGKNGLYSNVHDHEALGTKPEWQDLQSVCNEKAGPTDLLR